MSHRLETDQANSHSHEFYIDKPSNADLVFMLKSLPLPPWHTKLEMVKVEQAHIDIGERDYEKYISECLGKKVAPFSELILQLDQKTQTILPHNISFTGPSQRFMPYDEDIELRKARDRRFSQLMTRAIINGYNVDRITLKIENDLGAKGFTQFRDEMLDGMNNQGYRIDRGTLSILAHYPPRVRQTGIIHIDMLRGARVTSRIDSWQEGAILSEMKELKDWEILLKNQLPIDK